MSAVGHGRNRRRQPEQRVIHWGQYAGHKMGEVPTSYLRWFVDNAYRHMQARRQWAKQELQRRKEKGIL